MQLYVCSIRLLAHIALCYEWYCIIERILRDIRNLINVSLFSLLFVYSAVYISLLQFISDILLVDIKELRVETHRVRTH